MADTSNNFLNAEQAAICLGGLHSRTVTRWARDEYLPAYPIGEGKRPIWRYLRDDLAAWMVGRRNNGFGSRNELEESELYTQSSHRCSNGGVSK